MILLFSPLEKPLRELYSLILTVFSLKFIFPSTKCCESSFSHRVMYFDATPFISLIFLQKTKWENMKKPLKTKQKKSKTKQKQRDGEETNQSPRPLKGQVVFCSPSCLVCECDRVDSLVLVWLSYSLSFSSSQRRCKKRICSGKDGFYLLATLSTLAVQLLLCAETKCSSVLKSNLSFIQNYKKNNVNWFDAKSSILPSSYSDFPITLESCTFYLDK